MPLVYKWMAAPFGRLRLIGDDAGLAAITWENDREGRVRLEWIGEDSRSPVLVETERQLGQYFRQERKAFDIPLAFVGTAFHTQVWRALLSIPYGETRSYAQIAQQIGRPSAVRAVGAANGRNPVSIVVPCHRVIGASGALTGFAGGLSTKRFLLDLETSDLFDRPR